MNGSGVLISWDTLADVVSTGSQAVGYLRAHGTASSVNISERLNKLIQSLIEGMEEAEQ